MCLEINVRVYTPLMQGSKFFFRFFENVREQKLTSLLSLQQEQRKMVLALGRLAFGSGIAVLEQQANRLIFTLNRYL